MTFCSIGRPLQPSREVINVTPSKEGENPLVRKVKQQNKTTSAQIYFNQTNFKCFICMHIKILPEVRHSCMGLLGRSWIASRTSYTSSASVGSDRSGSGSCSCLRPLGSVATEQVLVHLRITLGYIMQVGREANRPWCPSGFPLRYQTHTCGPNYKPCILLGGVDKLQGRTIRVHQDSNINKR